MVESVLLVEGIGVDNDRLRSLSLSNAKQLLWGRLGTANVLHVAATSSEDLRDAVAAFSDIAGVTSVMTLAIRNPD